MISQASPFKEKNKNIITNGIEDYAQAIEDQGFHIFYNPPGDGSCQFAALSCRYLKLR